LLVASQFADQEESDHAVVVAAAIAPNAIVDQIAQALNLA
jgi:hypothetical protein